MKNNSGTEENTFQKNKEFNLREFFSLDGPFSDFMNVLGNVIWTGLLWLITSIPLITMGCSAMGAFRAIERAGNRRGYITKEFFAGFKSEWKTALPIQLVHLMILVWLIFDCIYLYGYGTDPALVISYVLYAILFFTLGIDCYYYPCLQRFEGNFFEIFKIAFYLTFRHLLTTIALAGLMAAAVFAVWLMPWSILIVPGLWWYAEYMLIRKVLDNYVVED